MNIINKKIDTLKSTKFSDRHFKLISKLYGIDGIRGNPNDEMIEQIDNHYESLSKKEKVTYFNSLKDMYELEVQENYLIKEVSIDSDRNDVFNRSLGNKTIKELKCNFLTAMKGVI